MCALSGDQRDTASRVAAVSDHHAGGWRSGAGRLGIGRAGTALVRLWHLDAQHQRPAGQLQRDCRTIGGRREMASAVLIVAYLSLFTLSLALLLESR